MTAAPPAHPAGVEACPKRMVFGPCGGVTSSGGCEVHGRVCLFLDPAAAPDPGAGVPGPRTPAPADHPFLARLRRGGAVVADLPHAALDAEALRRSATTLAGAVDAALTGDHGGARVQFPPALRASFVQRAGLRVIAGLNCRDRNRVALEGELAGLAAVGVAAVHCVTGDHPALGHRPDAQPVFDLDSTRLAALARDAGLLVSVAENPSAPPRELRARRLARKVAAGAQICMVNHTSGPDAVAAFVAAARAELEPGADVAFVACVPVVTDPASARVLRSFTGLELPRGYVEGILDAPDGRAAGIRAAVRLSEALLAVDGVCGVDLSGGAGPGREQDAAEIMAEVARGVRG